MVNNYDINNQYHPEKANVVANALCRKTTHLSVLITRDPRVKTFEQVGITVEVEGVRAQVVQLTVTPSRLMEDCCTKVLRV